MKKTYYVIPSSNIFNDKALVDRIRTAYVTVEEANKIAENLSRQYNTDFFVLALINKVSTKVSIISTK